MKRKIQTGLSMPTARPSLAPGARFDLLTPPEIALILAISERARDLATQWRITNQTDDVIEANPTVLQIDLSVVHLVRRLDLKAFLLAPSLDFISENATIQKHINRPLHSFPESVPLRYATNGAKVNGA